MCDPSRQQVGSFWKGTEDKNCRKWITRHTFFRLVEIPLDGLGRAYPGEALT